MKYVTENLQKYFAIIKKPENQLFVDIAIAILTFSIGLYLGWGLIRSGIVTFMIFHFLSPIPSKLLALWAFCLFLLMGLTLALGRREFAELFSQVAFGVLIIAVLTYFVRHDD